MSILETKVRFRVKVQHPSRLLLTRAKSYRRHNERTKFKKMSIRCVSLVEYHLIHLYSLFGRSSIIHYKIIFGAGPKFVSDIAEFQQFLSKIGLLKMDLKILNQVSERSYV